MPDSKEKNENKKETNEVYKGPKCNYILVSRISALITTPRFLQVTNKMESNN